MPHQHPSLAGSVRSTDQAIHRWTPVSPDEDHHDPGWGSIRPVRTLGNILWFVLAGFWLFLLYVVAGIIACVLIITIPLGVASFRIAGFVVWPFGRTAVKKSTAGIGSTIGNV